MPLALFPRAGKPLVGRYSRMLVRFGTGGCMGSALAGAPGLGTDIQILFGCVVGVALAWGTRNTPMPADTTVSGPEHP